MKIRELHKFIKSGIFFICPDCGSQMRVVYITDSQLTCDKCKMVYTLRLVKIRDGYEEIKKNGWGSR